MKTRRHPGWTLLVAYGALCAAALAYIAWAALAGGGQIELAGLLIVVLGLPWSIVLTFAVMAMGSSSPWLLGIGFGISCIANGWLLYRLGHRFASGR